MEWMDLNSSDFKRVIMSGRDVIVHTEENCIKFPNLDDYMLCKIKVSMNESEEIAPLPDIISYMIHDSNFPVNFLKPNKTNNLTDSLPLFFASCNKCQGDTLHRKNQDGPNATCLACKENSTFCKYDKCDTCGTKTLHSGDCKAYNIRCIECNNKKWDR